MSDANVPKEPTAEATSVGTAPATTPAAVSATAPPVATTEPVVAVDHKRKLKLESSVTAGLGKPKEKSRAVDTFWKIVWPALEKEGWTKVDGDHEETGMTYFRPKSCDVEYKRIKDILIRLEKGDTDEEAKIYSAYKNEMNSLATLEDAAKPKLRARTPPPSPPRTRTLTQSLPSPQPDMSWKVAKNFPRRASSVGSRYQVARLPEAGCYKDESNEKSDA